MPVHTGRTIAILSGGYDPDAQAFFTAAGSGLPAAWKKSANALIHGLKADGVWSLFGQFGIHAAPTTQAALVNARAPAIVGTLVGTPTPVFTANRGLAGDGSQSYADLGLTMAAAGAALNNATMFSYALTDVNLSTADIGTLGGTNSGVRPRSASLAMQPHANATATNVTINPGSSVGLTAWSRNNSANFNPYKDGVNLGNTASASTSMGTGNITLLRDVSTFSTRQVALSGVGAFLIDAQHAALNARCLTFLQAIGAR